MERNGYVSISLNLKLPESLAHEAEANGLLSPSKIGDMLREELWRMRSDRIYNPEAANDHEGPGVAPLTDEEIESEVQEIRESRRAALDGHA